MPICESTNGILVVEVHNIVSVVAMVPETDRLANGADREQFFAVEKPGLSVSYFVGGDGAVDNDDDIEPD